MTHPTDRLQVMTAVGLTAALVVVLSLTAWTGDPADAFGAGVVAVGAVVTLVAIVARGGLTPLFVALVVTGTFAVNTTLVGNPFEIPGSLGGWLWLVDVVLVVTVLASVQRGLLSLRSLSAIEWLFGLFVVWTVVVANLGAVPRPDVAIHYSVHALRGWLVLTLVAAAVRTSVLSLPGVAGAVVAAATGHAATACLQALAGDPLRFRTIAKGSTRQLGTLSVLGLEVGVGPYVSGFTAAGSLSGMLALALPLALVVALYGSSRRVRAAAAVAGVLMTLALRFTDWDSARGALLLEIGLVALYAVWRSAPQGWHVPRDLPPERLAVVGHLAALVAVLVYPSSTSGRGVGSGGAVDAGGLSGVSVPLFNLATLGIRLRQYLSGTAVFLDHPLFGVGGANFQYFAVRYGLPRPLLMHNVLIGLLAETGLPGFLLVTATLVGAAHAGLGLATGDRHPHLAVGALLAGVGYLAVLSWQPQWLRISSFLPFWAVVGALAGASDGRADRLERVTGA